MIDKNGVIWNSSNGHEINRYNYGLLSNNIYDIKFDDNIKSIFNLIKLTYFSYYMQTFAKTKACLCTSKLC